MCLGILLFVGDEKQQKKKRKKKKERVTYLVL